MRIYRLNENLSVRLKALQLYIYWGALKGHNCIPVSYTHLAEYGIANVKTSSTDKDASSAFLK